MCIHQQHHILESDRLPSRQYNADDQNGLLKTVFLLCNGLALINLFRSLKLVSKKKDIRIQILQCFKTNEIRIQISQYFKRKGIQILQNFKRNNIRIQILQCFKRKGTKMQILQCFWIALSDTIGPSWKHHENVK